MTNFAISVPAKSVTKKCPAASKSVHKSFNGKTLSFDKLCISVMIVGIKAVTGTATENVFKIKGIKK